MSPQVSFLLNKALESINNSNLESAELYLKQALRYQENNPHTLRLFGVISAQRGQYSEAIKYLKDSLKALPKNSLALSNLGNVFLMLKEYSNALDAYDKSLKVDPKYHEAWSNKGNALYELKRFEEAIAHHDKALSLKPDYAEAWYNKGVILHEINQYYEAIVQYDQALSLKPDYVEAWYNKGVTLHVLKRYHEAIAHYDQALIFKPDYAEAWSNKGVTLYELKQHGEAIAHYDQALIFKPEYAEAWSNKGVTLHELKQYDEAIANYDRALSLKPDIKWISGDLLHTKMKICSWSNLAESLENISKNVAANHKVVQPFALLAFNDDVQLHKKSAEIYTQDRCPFNPVLGPILKPSSNQKIRVAYFSADFKNHPVSYLTAELYELHDRNKFEIIAFSFTVEDKSEMRSRLSKTFDQFIDVSNMTDLEIAKLARELQIDIAVDLGGHTQDSRTGIFSYRAAPIQVNWLGYAGTIGAGFIDYIVADKIIIPESYQQYYYEKVVYLPHTFMVDDTKRVASLRELTRGNFGLPDGAFVFCCFNNDYKFNPQVLDSWSRILLTAKNSVIWISENNEKFRINIAVEFKNRGIDSERIIFAQRAEMMSEYLARYKLADLFLDTHPFNAHTTALDSLKSGVPILTLIGKSFASRVAASLLNAIGLSELITKSQGEYESLAVELAKSPQKLTDIKLKLKNNSLTTPLFDTPLFTKNLEAAYVQMYERYHADLVPDSITII